MTIYHINNKGGVRPPLFIKVLRGKHNVGRILTIEYIRYSEIKHTDPMLNTPMIWTKEGPMFYMPEIINNCVFVTSKPGQLSLF